MRIMMVGDIVGRPGRKTVKELVKPYRKKYNLDVVIANGENAAGGNGLTQPIAREMYDAGIDVITMGNHTWDKKEILEFIEHDPLLIRPANYPPGTPGRGSVVLSLRGGLKLGVINLAGRVFLPPLDCPFRAAESIVREMRKETNLIIIDFHAEATSEKIAFGWFMDGRVSAVVGTHTHVQTADERILPLGTGYITDVGMTGPRDSVLGVDKELVIRKFMSQMPTRFEVAGGPVQFNALLLDIDESSGRTSKIERIDEKMIRNT
ncbi:MAG: TIGR00282 family metallophosphoesterase [Peptococcaceae bacterium]|nr:TIGR00282 family metallophosphoesterase [Peptococcaceae bacterium]MDH7524118.1 TIGR00282 family metallophosphoesterase [Peptococcaceae bacterium]